MTGLDKLNIFQKSGNEYIEFNNNNIGWKLIDFWKWSVSDLLSNTTRGTFAEFIVATAMDIDLTKVREEWDAYDLETKDGIKIEIKTSAYLQTWYQKNFSNITFSIKSAYSWNAQTNESLDIKTRPSDVYVFCLLKHKDKMTVNPMDLNQWVFYIVSTKKINELYGDQVSLSLSVLEKICDSVNYDKIKEKIIEEYSQKN